MSLRKESFLYGFHILGLSVFRTHIDDGAKHLLANKAIIRFLAAAYHHCATAIAAKEFIEGV